MTASTVATRASVATPASPTFERFAGVCAVLAGAGGFIYAVSFLRLKSDLLNALMLLVIGLLTTAALVAVYERLREVDGAFALWALLLGILGAIGTAIHGGYDLANAVNRPIASTGDLPNQVDPRGLLTFGVAGIALLTVAWLILRGAQNRGGPRVFPAGLGYLGFAVAALLVVLYLGRLIVLDAENPLILVPAALNGFLLNPAWYVWLGLELWRGRRT